MNSEKAVFIVCNIAFLLKPAGLNMQLNYLFGAPSQQGRLKAEFEDFIVREALGYDFSDEGEFVVVHVRKTNANTLFVAEQLAKFVQIAAKNVSYAGLKDRHAVTEQWFYT